MIEQVVSFYHEDLPNPTIVDEKFCRWKSKWILIPKSERPDTIAKSLKKCPQQSLTNIWTILKLFATLPLSSCSCERSESTLKRLNNYMRSTQSEERLSSLAIIHINYTDLNIDQICRTFIQKHPRKLAYYLISNMISVAT